MDVLENKTQNSKKKNKYYDITVDEINNGKIIVHELKDGRALIVLNYGEKKDNTAVIALATITHGKADKYVIQKFQDMIISPDKNKLNDTKAIYEGDNLEMTPEGEVLLSESHNQFVVNSILQTVEYNPKEGKIDNIYTQEELYYAKIEAENYRNMQRLELYLKNLSKSNPEKYEKYKKGNDVLYTIMTINSLKKPTTYEEAIKIEEKLNSIEVEDELKSTEEEEKINFIEGFNEKSIIKYLNHNLDENNEIIYKEFLSCKLLAEMREKITRLTEAKLQDNRDEVKKISEEALVSQNIQKYLFSGGNIPGTIEDNEGLDMLEKKDIKEHEDLYLKSIQVLLQAADLIKTKYYAQNIDEIKSYCEIMEKFGVVYELDPANQLTESKPKSVDTNIKGKDEGFEPGD